MIVSFQSNYVRSQYINTLIFSSKSTEYLVNHLANIFEFSPHVTLYNHCKGILVYVRLEDKIKRS